MTNTRTASALLALGALALPCAAQAPPKSVPAPSAVLEPLGSTTATLQELVLPRSLGAPFTLEITLEGQLERLALWPHSVRSSGYQLLVQDESGVALPSPSDPSRTYRGIVIGRPESLVAASLFEGQLDALVRTAPGQGVWSIQPAAEFIPGAPAAQHVVSCSHDQLPKDWTCGTTEHASHTQPSSGTGGQASSGNPPLLLCEIACDTDVEYFVANGSSVSATEADIESIINGVDAIYQADVNITYVINAIIVRTAEPDPYVQFGAPATLNKLESEWIQNQTAILRDVVHLFVGRDLTGQIAGLANLSAVCSEIIGYGLVQSFATSDFATRVALSAHELGHNWSAGHCNNDPGGCNIMCAGIGACGPITSFAPVSDGAITSFSNAVGCLDQIVDPLTPPVIAAFSPSEQVPALSVGNDFHLSLIGTGLGSAIDVIVDGISLGNQFPPGFDVVNDTRIDVLLPLFGSLGTLDVTVINPLGTDTAAIELIVNSPPALQLGSGAAPETLLSFLPVELTVGGLPGSAHFIWASTSLSPTLIPGTFSLDIGAGFTDLFLAGFPIVEAKGWSEVSISGAVVPPGTTLYFQSFEYDPVSATLPAAESNVAEGFWLL